MQVGSAAVVAVVAVATLGFVSNSELNEVSKMFPAIRLSTFALLTLAACGGGGGKSGDPPTALYGVPSTVAETAARSAPRLGSVTQSSNVANDVTLDAAGIDHAANGDLILRVTRDNGASREISTGGNVTLLDVAYLQTTDDHPLLPNDSLYFVTLRSRTDGTFVHVLSTKRASLGPAPGAERFREGDSASGWFEGETWELAAGTHEAHLTLDGPDDTDYSHDGVYCESGTGTCRVEDSRVVEGTIYLKVGGPAAVVRNWDSTDTDYLVFGWWLRPATTGATQPEVGIFVDGGRPFSASEFTTLTGTATYAGGASAYALGDSNAADVAPFLLPSSEGEDKCNSMERLNSPPISAPGPLEAKLPCSATMTITTRPASRRHHSQSC